MDVFTVSLSESTPLIDLFFIIEVFLTDKFFRSEFRFVVHQIVARGLKDSLLSVVRSFKSFEGGGERAISAGRQSGGEDWCVC